MAIEMLRFIHRKLITVFATTKSFTNFIGYIQTCCLINVHFVPTPTVLLRLFTKTINLVGCLIESGFLTRWKHNLLDIQNTTFFNIV